MPRRCWRKVEVLGLPLLHDHVGGEAVRCGPVEAQGVLPDGGCDGRHDGHLPANPWPQVHEDGGRRGAAVIFRIFRAWPWLASDLDPASSEVVIDNNRNVVSSAYLDHNYNSMIPLVNDERSKQSLIRVSIKLIWVNIRAGGNDRV